MSGRAEITGGCPESFLPGNPGAEHLQPSCEAKRFCSMRRTYALNCHGAHSVCECQPGEPELKAVEIIPSHMGKR